MSDRLFFAAAAAVALGLVGLALVWPQGHGRPSPAPFGGPQVVSDAGRQDLKSAREAAATAQGVGLRP